MAKLAERIKADFVKEFNEFADELAKAVEKHVREDGSCRISLNDKFEAKRDYRSMSDVRIPQRLVSIVENEYTFQGFRIEHHYTPAGRLHAITIKL